MASVLSHENTHRLDNIAGRDTYEANAYGNGFNTYEDLKKAFELKGDSGFINQMLAGLVDPDSYIANSGDVDFLKLVEKGDGSLGWQEDGSTDFDLRLLGMGTVEAGDMDDSILSNILAKNGFLSYENTQNIGDYRYSNEEAFRNGTQSFVDASRYANALINVEVSNNNLKLFNSALREVQESGLLVENSIDIDTIGLVNVGPPENPVYVPVQLGDGQSVHETSSYPGFRLLNISRGITPHSGIDLRGIWDSNVVSAANDSNVTLKYDRLYGLNAENSFDKDKNHFKNILSHLEVQPTIMSYLKAFGSEGITLNGNSLSGLPAGMVLGNVGNTGNSLGAHLDWRTYEFEPITSNGNGSFENISPLESSIYKNYLNNDITATSFAKYLTNLPGKDAAEIWDSSQTWNNFNLYWKETRDIDFIWDLTTIHGFGW